MLFERELSETIKRSLTSSSPQERDANGKDYSFRRSQRHSMALRSSAVDRKFERYLDRVTVAFSSELTFLSENKLQPWLWAFGDALARLHSHSSLLPIIPLRLPRLYFLRNPDYFLPSSGGISLNGKKQQTITKEGSYSLLIQTQGPTTRPSYSACGDSNPSI